MRRTLLLAVALSACTGKSNRADSADAALPAVDTIKAVVASDTGVVAIDSGATKAPAPATTKSTTTKAPTDTKGARDSAFPPPRNLPKLDTVGAKKKPL